MAGYPWRSFVYTPHTDFACEFAFEYASKCQTMRLLLCISLSKLARSVFHSLLPGFQYVGSISMIIEPITAEVGRFPKHDSGRVHHQQNFSEWILLRMLMAAFLHFLVGIHNRS